MNARADRLAHFQRPTPGSRARFRVLLARTALAAALVLGCATSKLGSRSQVAGGDGPITTSLYAPEREEKCGELGRQVCRYWNDPSRSVLSQCSESVLVQATNSGANYMYVNVPNSTDLHYDTDLPTAIFYRCENLIESE